MPKCLVCLSALLLLPALAACGAQPEAPPAEVPVQPLVVGTSAPPTVAPPPPQVHEAPLAVAAATTLAVPARDPRLTRPARSPALVQTELKALEQMLAVTAAGSPDLGPLLRRLADDYAELSRSGDPALIAGAHQQALKYYERVIAATKQPRNVEEAYYFAALEHEMSGDPRNARKNLYEVIKQFPQSKLVPLAYFGFGEMFLAEADSDPSKLALAEQAYVEVLKYPPATNPVFSDAQARRQEVKDLQSGAKIRRP
jgi:TolA-binding protein